jgi:hypothetical protein
MRRGSVFFPTFVLQVAGFCMVAAWAAPALAVAPKIHIAETQKDLGTIIEGDKPTITWLVKNEGTADLVIDRTQSTCGCTVVKLEDKDKVIPPGGALELKVEFHSAGRRGRDRRPELDPGRAGCQPADPRRRTGASPGDRPLDGESGV